MSGRANFEPIKKRSRPKAAQVWDSRRRTTHNSKAASQCRKTGGFASSPQTMLIARPEIIVGAVGLEVKTRKKPVKAPSSTTQVYARARPFAMAFFVGGDRYAAAGSAE
jgi:hypothetical protein